MTDHPIPDSYWVSPGQLLAGEYPSARRESPARKKLGAILDAGIRSFVDLTEPDDHVPPYDALVRTIAAEKNCEAVYRRLSLPAGDVPPIEQMTLVLAHIDSEIAAGRPVYVHCLAGISRTGIVVGCWMVGSEGRSALAALHRIAELRKGIPDGHVPSPETRAQREFVVQWQCAVTGKPGMSLRERCDALLEFAPHFDSDSFATLVSPAMGEGLLGPYCQLSPWATAFVRTIEDAGWCTSCDWQAWRDEGHRYVGDPALVANADVEILAKLLTLHVQLDRLNEGHLIDMAEQGHLQAILGRLRELRDQHTGG